MSKKIDILTEYLEDYGNSFTGREVARRIKSSPQATLNVLNELIQDKIIISTKEGRNKKYKVNSTNFRALLYLELAEINRSSEYVSNFELKKIIERLIPLAETIVVFGSFAKKTQKEESDLDLVIINPLDKQKIRKISQSFPRDINIQFITWKGFKKSINDNNHLSTEIKMNHVVFGNVEKFIRLYLK